jgi:hypothetical protein
MLKIVEYSLMAVSLLVVLGLIVSGSRNDRAPSPSPDPALPKEVSEAQEPGKTT